MDNMVGQHGLKRLRVTVDGNEAAASVAHRVSEVIAIYPITPSSPMILPGFENSQNVKMRYRSKGPFGLTCFG